MEKQFTVAGPVLDREGRPVAGWASEGILQYRRRDIRAPFYRIKEWDWYQVSDAAKALQFTFGHASYAGQIGVMLFDFEKGEKIFTKDKLLALPFGSLRLEESAERQGVLLYDKKDMKMRFENRGDTHALYCACPGFEAEVTLTRQNPHSLVINVPFKEQATAFYYNQKINCMTAAGRALVSGREYVFDKEAYGLLDWGRGVWPFKNEWYWSNATGSLQGEIFGFNLGCGFGDTSAATENCLFYKKELHKLGPVRFELDEQDYTRPWRFTDEEGRLDLTLRPVYDRETAVKMLWVDNNTHQMFGSFTGQVVLNDGTKLQVDDIIGFAEHAKNQW